MRYRKPISTLLLLLAGILDCPSVVYGQEQQNDTPPKPAAKAIPPIGGEDEDADQAPVTLLPDDRPLTGIQDATLGMPPETHSYWIPSVSYYNFVQSNALTEGGTTGWNSTNFVTGNLSLLENWSNAQLSLNYSGGGSISADSGVGNGNFYQFQSLGVMQTFKWRRVKLLLLDEFSYLPEAQFGFGAGSGISIPGVGGSLVPGLPGLENGFTPSQTVFTEVGPRYSNAAGTQINWALTRRSSFTLGGVFGLLRFPDGGSIESNEAIFNAGYYYQMSKSDSIGVAYRFSAYEFLGSPEAVGDHFIQVVYGKKITGRLVLQLSGGPEITNYRVPLVAGTKTQAISGAGSAVLQYAFSGGNLSFNYNHGVNNGSGALLGATSDLVTVTGTRRLTRVWGGNVSVGYARSTSVLGVSTTQNQAYNALYVGAGVQRALGRAVGLSLNYTADIQISTNAVCAGPNCGSNFTTHTINVGLNWRGRPFVLH
jgi:hypothetical protein